jgi:hypothetical protein
VEQSPDLVPALRDLAVTAETSADGSSGDATPNDRRDANAFHDSGESPGLAMQNSVQACSACTRKSSSESANSGGADPMTRKCSGSSPATYR